VPFNEAFSRRYLFTITQRVSLALILFPSDERHVSVNDKNNDDILRFPNGNIGLYSHKRLDTLSFLTAGPEVLLSSAGRKVRYAAHSSDNKTGGSYRPPSALNHRITFEFL
jgi:hypothetical protein